MSLEQRRGRCYYYRKVREGGRVRSEYMGSGLQAQLSAEEDESKRRERKAQRAADRADRHAEAQIDRQFASVESAIAAMTHATMFAAGYHQHKGQWRKKRHEK
jgi:hypothetical protein